MIEKKDVFPVKLKNAALKRIMLKYDLRPSQIKEMRIMLNEVMRRDAEEFEQSEKETS